MHPVLCATSSLSWTRDHILFRPDFAIIWHKDSFGLQVLTSKRLESNSQMYNRNQEKSQNL